MDAGGGQGGRRILVLPLLRWVILLALVTYLWTVVSFLLSTSSAASCTYCFLYAFKYAKWSRLAKRFTQLCALCFDVIALSLTIIGTTFKNLLKYIHIATTRNRPEWYEVKGNCLLLWPISCSHSLDTHFLVFFQEICTHTHTHRHAHTYYEYVLYPNLRPEPFCLLSARHQEARRSGRRRMQFSSPTNMDSQCVSLTTASPCFNDLKYVARAIFLKFCCPRVAAQSVWCFLQSSFNFSA